VPDRQRKLTSGPKVEAISTTVAQERKGTFRIFADSQPPKRMGQRLKIFLPKREKPAINPKVSRTLPFMGTLARVRTARKIRSTTAEFTKAAPIPARAI